jgi:cytochrome c556
LNKAHAAAFLGASIMGLALGVRAENDPQEIIKYRQNVMKSLGGHAGAMTALVRGKVDMPNQLLIHAQALHAVTGTISTLFPEGSDFGETDAKPEIWTHWDEFEDKARKVDSAAAGLLKTVEQGSDASQVQMRFKELGESCKACHKKFRAEKK